MNLAEKSEFLISNVSVQYIEKDFELYKRVFPNSQIIPGVEEKIRQYKEGFLPEKTLYDFDERMLSEILDTNCTECILENRGIIKDYKQDENQNNPEESEETEEEDPEEKEESEIGPEPESEKDPGSSPDKTKAETPQKKRPHNKSIKT